MIHYSSQKITCSGESRVKRNRLWALWLRVRVTLERLLPHPSLLILALGAKVLEIQKPAAVERHAHLLLVRRGELAIMWTLICHGINPWAQVDAL